MAVSVLTKAILNKLQRSSVMKQNKLLILSLLASFLLLISASYATAQNAVTFGTVDDCPRPMGDKVYVPVMVNNDVDLGALDIIGTVVSDGNVDLVVTGITFDNRMALPEALDQRYTLTGDPFRLGGIMLNHSAGLIADDGQIATLELEYLSDCLLGTATLEYTSITCGPGVNTTMLVDKAANIVDPVDLYPGAVNVVNMPPYFTYCPGPQVIYWGQSITETLVATDPDLACGCDELSFTMIGGVGSVNSVTGLYQYVAQAADIGCQFAMIEVTDRYGLKDTCYFTIDVLNHPPVITECPDEVINILWGQTVTTTVVATDPDMGPQSLEYSLKPGHGAPGGPSVGAGTGIFEWVTAEDPAYVGLWEFCVIVDDGAPLDSCNTENADTCCFFVHVQPKHTVIIEKVHDQLQGHYAYVSITLEDGIVPMGGFDFLIAYDASALTFIEATPGQLLEDCGWEYFTYRYGWNGNCGDACPSGLLRIVAMAETNNGPNHPDCYGAPDYDPYELAELKFFVTNDRTFECMFVPIIFFWMDCTDNVISSQFGDTLFIEDEVWHYRCTSPYVEVSDEATEFPSMYGVPEGWCLEGDKEYPLEAIDFFGGGIDIVCADSIDKRGDINANGLANEIADAVMFTNYFISGLSAFGDHVEASIAASDVNADGIALSVADLVYLIRVIQGDAPPYPKVGPDAETIAINTQLVGNRMTVGYNALNPVGAVLMRFEFSGEIGIPELGAGAAAMDLKYSVNGSELSVLVFNIGDEAIKAGENVLVTIPVTGDMTLTEVDAADFYGNTLSYTAHILPSKYELAQNYPNPFNPSTTINLALPVASDYTVAIYNIAGQLIRAYSGHASAGVKSIVWDGKDASGNQVASGIYFYKAQAGQFSATKKMLLMK
jgi:hypothetical protein